MKKWHGRGTGAWQVVAEFLVAGCAWAGSLAPTNGPGATMHTLEDIYRKISLIETNMVRFTVATNLCDGVPETGQTEVHQGGDDGDLKMGAAWPVPRFTVDATGSNVLDNFTGLMWTRNANIWGELTWSDAVNKCNSLVWGGYDDWRLPNLRELNSLRDYGRYPTLPEGHAFTDLGSWYYWSSTSVAEDPTRAWLAGPPGGYTWFDQKVWPQSVWPVRGGL